MRSSLTRMKSAASGKAVLTRGVVLCEEFIHKKQSAGSSFTKIKCYFRKSSLSKRGGLGEDFNHRNEECCFRKSGLNRVVLFKEFIHKNEVCCFKKSGLNKRGGLMQGVHSQK